MTRKQDPKCLYCYRPASYPYQVVVEGNGIVHFCNPQCAERFFHKSLPLGYQQAPTLSPPT